MADGITENLLEESAGEKQSSARRVWKESQKIWVVAAPAMFCRFTTYGTGIITQAFVGHVGSIELAAFALVFTVFIRFAQGVLLGMANGLETLCGQAYGAGQYHMLGIYLQRSWLISAADTTEALSSEPSPTLEQNDETNPLGLSLKAKADLQQGRPKRDVMQPIKLRDYIIVSAAAATAILPLFILTAPILKLLGQDAEIAEMAGTMSLWMIPAMYSYILAYTCQMYLQAQSKNMIIAYLSAASLALHVLLSWLLTVKLDYGVPGAMISTIIAFWLPNLGQLAFIACGGCPLTWRGFSMQAFQDLWPIFKLSLSAGAMLCLEVWYYPVIILLTGNMKNAEVAIDALSICININGWELMISLGFMAAASVRIANELGAGNSKAAKFSIATIVLTSSAIGLVFFVFFVVYRGRVAYLFTDNPDVVDSVDSMSFLLAISILLNSVQPVLSGVAIGSGWQSTVAWVNLTTYYLIGLPLGVLLGFGYLLNLGVNGVWIGMLVGVLVQTLVLVFITYRTDWEQQVAIAQRRVNRWLVKDERDAS